MVQTKCFRKVTKLNFIIKYSGAFLFFLLLISCASIDKTQLYKDDEEKKQMFDMICGNISETDISAQVKVKDVDEISALGGYSLYKYTAQILEVFHGKIKTGEIIIFYDTIERDLKPHPKSSELLVSLTKRQEEGYESPDTGYIFSFSDEILEMFRNAVE